MFTKEGNRLIATERLYLNAAQDKALKEGEAGAATLLACKGGEIPARYAKLFVDEKPETKGTDPETRSTRPARVFGKR